MPLVKSKSPEAFRKNDGSVNVKATVAKVLSKIK
jgi:hypothetical protein